MSSEHPQTNQEPPRGLVDITAKKLPLQWHLIQRLFQHAKVYPILVSALLALTLIRAACLPSLTWIMGAVIGGPIKDANPYGHLWGTIGFGALTIFTAVGFFFRHKLSLVLGERVVHDLRKDMFQKLLIQPLDFFSHTRQGRLINRFISDVESLRIGIQQVLFVSIVQGGQMLIAGVFLAYYDWRLFLILMGWTPVYWFLNQKMREQFSSAMRAAQESFSRVTSSLAEAVGGIRVTQSMVREEVNAARFRELIYDHSRYNMDIARTSSIFGPLFEFIGQLFVVVLIGLGGTWALNSPEQFNLADFIQFVFLTSLFLSPITVISSQYQQALAAMAGAERVFRLLDFQSPWPESTGTKQLETVRGDLRFESVSFSYTKGHPILHDISFDCPAGTTVALVGKTGSGKSSIINLLCGFYRVDSGQIYIDDHELNDLDPVHLRSFVGMVPQNSFLFEGTLRENLVWICPEATDGHIYDAADQLGLKPFLERLSDGLDTQVGDEGGILSSGERQLLCLIRAWLADPKLIIFDEATSAVDALTEMEFQSAFENIRKNRTTIVVAHRLSTIRDANQILVMDQGRIVERGSHDTLMQQAGLYQNLYESFRTGKQQS